MPRPPRPIPYEQFKISLPPELAAEVRLRCFSPIHVYGAPKGAFSTLFETALRAYFEANPLVEETPDEKPAEENQCPGEADNQA
jgi:hypothetical protein